MTPGLDPRPDTATREGALPALPTVAEVEAFLVTSDE